MKLRELFESSDDIIIVDQQITELPDNLPNEIKGRVNCSRNQLTTLVGLPSKVGGSVECSFNKLTSLEGCSSEIGNSLVCDGNKITSLKDIHKHIKSIGEYFSCYSYASPIESHILGLMLIHIGNKIQTGAGNGHDVDTILNKWKNQGRKGVMGAMKELTDLGYEELAQL